MKIICILDILQQLPGKMFVGKRMGHVLFRQNLENETLF